jgi:hypothetical protein
MIKYYSSKNIENEYDDFSIFLKKEIVDYIKAYSSLNSLLLLSLDKDELN